MKRTFTYRDDKPASQELNEKNFNEILTVISQEDAEASYDAPELAMHYDNKKDIRPVGLYKGDLHVSSISAGHKSGEAMYKLIVDGNLIVDSTIDWYNEINDSYLIVTGDVITENIIISGDPTVYFGGNVVAENVLMCYGGEDGGNLTIGGDVTAQLVLCTTYFTMSVGGAINAVKITDDDSNFESDYKAEELTEMFLDGFIDEEDEIIDEEAIRKAVLAGKKVLKS